MSCFLILRNKGGDVNFLFLYTTLPLVVLRPPCRAAQLPTGVRKGLRKHRVSKSLLNLD